MIDDGLLKDAMEILGLKTKRAVVEGALRRIIAEDRREKAIQTMRGLGWEGDLEAMRDGRNSG